VKLLNVDDVRAVVAWPDAVEAMRSAFTALADGRAVAPNEFAMTAPAPGDIHVKGAYLHGSKWVVVKLAAGGFPTPGNHGCFLIISAVTGEIDTFINDGGWLTEARTAAAGALSIEILARPEASVVAMIGSGVQAGFQLEALRAIRLLTDVRVVARSIDRVHSFAAAHGARPCTTIAEAIDGADIVICTTTSQTAVLDRVAPGTHITSIGVDMVGKCEPSHRLITTADIVVVDDIAVSRAVGILQAGATPTAPMTLGDILTNRRLGRETAQQVTLAGLSGLGVQDAAIAELVMQRLH
jgi:ornithine cyclodeaminase